jgi:hypothetical protein
MKRSVWHNGNKITIYDVGETIELHGVKWIVGEVAEGKNKGKEHLLNYDRYNLKEQPNDK